MPTVSAANPNLSSNLSPAARELLRQRELAEAKRAELNRRRFAVKASKRRVSIPKYDAEECVSLNIRIHTEHRAAIIQLARRANMTVAAYILHQLGFADKPVSSPTQSSPVQEDRDARRKKLSLALR